MSRDRNPGSKSGDESGIEELPMNANELRNKLDNAAWNLSQTAWQDWAKEALATLRDDGWIPVSGGLPKEENHPDSLGRSKFVLCYHPDRKKRHNANIGGLYWVDIYNITAKCWMMGLRPTHWKPIVLPKPPCPACSNTGLDLNEAICGPLAAGDIPDCPACSEEPKLDAAAQARTDDVNAAILHQRLIDGKPKEPKAELKHAEDCAFQLNFGGSPCDCHVKPKLIAMRKSKEPKASQAEHIKLLQDCDDTSRRVIGEMDIENKAQAQQIAELQNRIKTALKYAASKSYNNEEKIRAIKQALQE